MKKSKNFLRKATFIGAVSAWPPMLMFLSDRGRPASLSSVPSAIHPLLLFIPAGARFAPGSYTAFFFEKKIEIFSNLFLRFIWIRKSWVFRRPHFLRNSAIFALYKLSMAWNAISIIDPLFTLPILTLIVIGMIKKGGTWCASFP